MLRHVDMQDAASVMGEDRFGRLEREPEAGRPYAFLTTNFTTQEYVLGSART